MNPICFYHKADLDGVCSAAIVKHFVPECELYGIDYGDGFPWGKVEKRPGGVGSEKLRYDPDLDDPGFRRTVYMVDFSLPSEDMKRLAAVSNLVWIDHHKSAIDSVDPVGIRGIQCVWYAGCELCWAWFSTREFCKDRNNDAAAIGKWIGTPIGQRLPEVVRLLGRYDIRAKDDPEWAHRILPFQYGMRAIDGIYDPLSSIWEWAFKEHAELGILLYRGRAILAYQAEQNRRACEAGAHEFVWTMPDPDKQPFVEVDARGQKCVVWPGPRYTIVGGKCERVPDNVMPSFRVLACNTTVFNSQFFDGFYDPEKHDVMCAYCQLKDGRWKVSLYSTKPGIDCGVIAKTFGGGGHFSAAGFVCDRLPWGGA